MRKTAKLGEILDVRRGTTITKKQTTKGQIPVIGGGIKPTYFHNKANRKANCITISGSGASAGFVNIWNEPIFASDCTTVESINGNQLHQFIFYYLLSQQEFIYKNFRSGAAQPHVYAKDIATLEYPILPFAEQERITYKLNSTFAEIEKTVSLSKQSAISAKKLYSRQIDRVFAPLYEKAELLGSHSEINYGYTAKASLNKGTHKYLRITDIQDNSVNWDSVPYCEIEEQKIEKMQLHDGDIVFARTGATTGKSFLVKKPTDAIFASYLIRVSVNRDVLLPRYVMHFFQSESYWQQINKGITGTAQGGFNASKLAKLRIPIAEKEEQLNLIENLDKIYEQSKRLVKVYEAKLEQLKILKSTILAKELQCEL